MGEDMGTYVFLGCLVAAIAWAALTYNALVRGRHRVDEAWSDVDVQLRRRHDLVPNLAEVVRAYAAHEQQLMAFVSDARAEAAGAGEGAHRERAETELSEALSQLRATAEHYPELAASEHFLRLHRQLAEVENEVRAARRIYNSNVEHYNVRVQSFPSALIAAAGAFRPRRYFEVAPSTAIPMRALQPA
jgi:LemA protein